MIDVGERTGALESMLTKIADFYEDQVNTMVNGLTSLIEPLLIVFLGVVVGFIVISMFMPMFKMIEVISH
jgi:type IV pilus assembly protein PilC